MDTPFPTVLTGSPVGSATSSVTNMMTTVPLDVTVYVPGGMVSKLVVASADAPEEVDEDEGIDTVDDRGVSVASPM